MREFWVSSGHHLTRTDAAGALMVTDELLLALLARPEVLPPPEACAAERGLHARLSKDPRAAVAPAAIAAKTTREGPQTSCARPRGSAASGDSARAGRARAGLTGGEGRSLAFFNRRVSLSSVSPDIATASV